MYSMTALLAQLPPASLAEDDLARWLSRALGRREARELPGIRALLDEEVLTGFPMGFGGILAAFLERLIEEDIDPADLNPDFCDQLLASHGFVTAISKRVEVERQWVRPGVWVTPALRDQVAKRLRVLEGVGAQLAIVSPVELLRLPGVRHAIPRAPVVAKPTGNDEAEAMRAAWGAIEESFGIEGPHAAIWRARFIAIARRANHDVAAVKVGLASVTPTERARLFAALIDHFRDQEVPEAHRPGRRGLVRRLTRLGFESDLQWIEALLPLAEFAYKGAGRDDDVARGICPCAQHDIEMFRGWTEEAPVTRERIAEMKPEEITEALVLLSEIEAGTIDRPIDRRLRRALRSFRDKLLRARYARSPVALMGVDPLVLTDARLAVGADRTAIIADLDAVGQAAVEAARSMPQPVAREPEPAVVEPVAAVPVGVSAEPVAAPPDPEPIEPDAAGPRRPTFDSPFANPFANLEPIPQRDRETTKPGRDVLVINPFGEQKPRFELPPMPRAPRPRGERTQTGRQQRPPSSSAVLADAVAAAQRAVPRGAEQSNLTEPPPRAAPPRTAPARRALRRTRPVTGGAGPSDRGETSVPADKRPARRGVAQARAEARARTARSATGRPRSPFVDAERPRPVTASSPTPTSDDAGEAKSAVAARPAETRSATQRTRARAERPVTKRPDASRRRPKTAPRVTRSTTASGAGRTRPATVPHLVTPRQANAFYDSAFKELEALERDMLQRGSWPAASERLAALEQEASELASALGPAARSGDSDFASALNRVQRVQSYLTRLAPLADGAAPIQDDDADPPKKRRGFFRRKS